MSLFDARTALNSEDGAGIQLNGGLAALGKIDGDLQQAVMDAGMRQVGIRSRTKAWENPSSTNFDTLLELDLMKLVRDAGGDITAGLVREDNTVLWYSIMRGALQVIGWFIYLVVEISWRMCNYFLILGCYFDFPFPLHRNSLISRSCFWRNYLLQLLKICNLERS